jgi:hypothetical protein
MIADKDLLQIVMQKYPDQDIDFIINQFSIYKQKLSGLYVYTANTKECQQGNASARAIHEGKERKKYTKRVLKVKPFRAITKDSITCCLCGKICQNLTASHLMKEHGLTPEEYKKLCGYGSSIRLMSGKNLLRVQHAVANAQAARRKKD